MNDTDDRLKDSWQSLQQAFQGQRFELTGGASKMLRLLLERPDGCDVRITRARFEVKFPWHPSLHPYDLYLAPLVVSQLLFWSKHVVPKDPIRILIGPETIRGFDYKTWSFGRRLLWIERTEDEVTIQVRDGATHEATPN